MGVTTAVATITSTRKMRSEELFFSLRVREGGESSGEPEGVLLGCSSAKPRALIFGGSLGDAPALVTDGSSEEPTPREFGAGSGGFKDREYRS